MTEPNTLPEKDQLLSVYRRMQIIRRTEELLVKFYAAGQAVRRRPHLHR